MADLGDDPRAGFDATAYPLALIASKAVAPPTQQVRLGLDVAADQHAQASWATDGPWLLTTPDAHAVARQLAQRYGLRGLAHFNPPMGFIRDPVAVQECLAFVEAHSPFRFCLLAVGAPQQESLAQQLKARGVARGLALCIGASINFLTGEERRAPLWMQRSGMEWAYRLMQAPTRMASRYLVRGPRVFSLLLKARIVLRKTAAPIPVPSSSPIPAPAPRRVPQSVIVRG